MHDDWEEDTNPWIDKGATRPFENDWFAIDRHEVIHPDGEEGFYTVVRPKKLAVGVLPIEDDGRVHLVGQWRFAVGHYSWEMPAGGAEPGEQALTCAQRELEEETGLVAARHDLILSFDLSNSITDERGVIYLATGLTPGRPSPDGTEVLKRRTAPFAEVLQRVGDGRIRDGFTVAAVLRAHHMAVSGQLPAELARAMLGPREGE